MHLPADGLPFWLAPWDQPRPRRRFPVADGVWEQDGKTYLWRAQNGLLFFRDSSRAEPEFTLAAGMPFQPGGEATQVLASALESGNVARYILLEFRDHHRRDIPLFFRPNGTGFCRESWNQDDIPFRHDLSLHDWLEAPSSALQNIVRDIFTHEIAPQLERLTWPTDHKWPLSFQGGSREALNEIIAAIVALEPPLREGGKIVRVSGQAESPFSRAGVSGVNAEAGMVRTFFDEATGERYLNEYWEPTVSLTQRFWTLCDWAVDWITPRGIYWDLLDRGRGRLAKSPHAADFSFQYIVPKLPDVETAQQTLLAWLEKYAPPLQVDKVLQYTEVPDFPIREDV